MAALWWWNESWQDPGLEPWGGVPQAQTVGASRRGFEPRSLNRPAGAPKNPMSKTLFEKIVAREIPAQIVFEDDLVMVVRDLHPQAPTHVLIFPKKAVPRIAEAGPEDHPLLGHLLLKAAVVADRLGLKPGGYRLVINNGADGGETIPHLHCHILGGRQLAWPPG